MDEEKPLPSTDSQPEFGKGGAEHLAIQQTVRETAHDNGWKASIEESLPDGGQVDVGLQKEGVRIACEVSITTRKSDLKKTILK